MGYKHNDPCLTKAEDDEPIFVLLARDVTAPDTVLMWCAFNRLRQPSEKLEEARRHAQTMQDWRVKREERT